MEDPDALAYQELFDRAMRDTVAIGGLPKEWEGTTGKTRDAIARCGGSAVFIDGTWKGQTVRGLLTAGHVAREFVATKGTGAIAIGRMRQSEEKTGRGIGIVEVIHTDIQLGANLRVRSHREVRFDDRGLLWLSRDGAETLRSQLGCVGYNPGRMRRANGERVPKAICAAANNAARGREEGADSLPEAVFGVNELERGIVTCVDRETGEKLEKQIWMTSIEEATEDMGGTSGAGVWSECSKEDGGGQLIGIVGSHLNGWPTANEHKLLIQPLGDILDWATKKGGSEAKHRIMDVSTGGLSTQPTRLSHSLDATRKGHDITQDDTDATWRGMRRSYMVR